jgi:phage terminase large subunit-like protein
MGRRLSAGLVPFTVEHFEAWAGRHILDTGESWMLDDFERAFIADVLSGVRISWLVVPEGNGKTTLIAGLALYHIEFTASGYVAVAASTRDQAEWIYRQASGLVLASERDREFKCLEGYRRIRFDARNARIQVFAADDRGGDGAIASLFILDELHRHKDLSLYRTWSGKLPKRGGQLVAISTAGEVGGEFEVERERFRKEAPTVERSGAFTRAVAENAVLHDWAVEEGADLEDLEAVKAANPSPRITLDDLRQKRATPGMTAGHWARFTGNRAARSEQAAVTEAEWAAARTDVMIPEGASVWLGLDIGLKYDTTALVPLWVRDPHFRLLGEAKILEPPRETGNLLDVHVVEEALLCVHARNPVEVVVMDMTSNAQFGQWIEENLGAEVVDRGQGVTWQALDYARFMEALGRGWLKHTGDPGLTSHVLNAVAKPLPSGGTKFERPKMSRTVGDVLARQRVVDALDAAAMVHTSAAAGLDAPATHEPLVVFA